MLWTGGDSFLHKSDARSVSIVVLHKSGAQSVSLVVRVVWTVHALFFQKMLDSK